MARRKMDLGPLAKAIFDGEHDDELAGILAAAQARQKNRFRKGTRVRVVGTKNPRTDGKVGVVLKVNPKTIQVGVGNVSFAEWDTEKQFPDYEGGEWNMSSSFLEVVTD